MLQESVWQISLVLMGLLAFAFAFVHANSHRREQEYAPLQKRAYRLRTRLFWALVLTLGPAMIYNLIDLPYGAARAGMGAESGLQVVDAVGYQWRWELSRNQLAAGQPVEFRITAADVNHGFGIYDTQMRLVAQAQAMPGYVNKLRHTFNQEGTYRILCMEYCGVAHHNMIAEIQVANR